jgi:hypothetical protein
LGFNTVRLYHPPSDRLLSEAQGLDLQLIVGLPWADHGDFLSSRRHHQAIIAQIQTEVLRLKDHPSIMAFIVGNEIEKTLVRWLGPSQVQRFLEQLITAGRRAAPNKLFSYSNYPSTEYLTPRNADFLAFNVYLEQRADFSAYLQRLHHLAGNKPLLISEFGLDTATHGEEKQAQTRSWFEVECAQAAVGHVWFSYTDEWFRDGVEVTDWQFGLVDRERNVRPAAKIEAETMKLPCPFISVIVCTYNGTGTLRDCLSSLQKLHYPSYEILVIDDGFVAIPASLHGNLAFDGPADAALAYLPALRWRPCPHVAGIIASILLLSLPALRRCCFSRRAGVFALVLLALSISLHPRCRKHHELASASHNAVVTHWRT